MKNELSYSLNLDTLLKEMNAVPHWQVSQAGGRGRSFLPSLTKNCIWKNNSPFRAAGPQRVQVCVVLARTPARSVIARPSGGQGHRNQGRFQPIQCREEVTTSKWQEFAYLCVTLHHPFSTGLEWVWTIVSVSHLFYIIRLFVFLQMSKSIFYRVFQDKGWPRHGDGIFF